MMTFRIDEKRRVAVNLPDFATALRAVEARLVAGRGFTLATLNLDHLVKLRVDAAFRDAYCATDFVTADGTPVVWMSRLAKRPLGLAQGSELVGPLCAVAARCGAPIAIIGSSPQTLESAAARLVEREPGLRVAHLSAPPFGFDPGSEAAQAEAEAVARSGARLCFLALGSPKQERFAARAARIAPECGFVSVGAGIDFIAGAQRRAPAIVRRFALEWLWRMLGDPRRLAMRYLRCGLILPALTTDALRLRAQAPVDAAPAR